MICVCLGCESAEELQAAHRAQAAAGVSLVEYRLDYLAGLPDPAALLSDRPTPVVVTCRRKSDQGHWRFSEAQRRDVLRRAVAAGAEFVDLEDDIIDEIPREGTAKRIVSRHDFNGTPANLPEIHGSLRRHDADLLKLVTMAHSPRDAVRMLDVVRNSEVPTLGFCMGEWGAFSRVLCGRYGSPWTYAAPAGQTGTAPGQFTYGELAHLYRYDNITADTPVFGVLGDPIGHSLSPLLHNSAFREIGFDGLYLPFRVAADDFTGALDAFERLDVRGYSVTIPHKQAAMQRADRCDPAVHDIGAANTLVRERSGEWSAANTDYTAILESLLVGLEAEQPDRFDENTFAGRTVLMLGAGGVARSAGLGVVRCGGRLLIANRTPERAAELARTLGGTPLPWEQRHSAGADIVINCTSLGMHPHVDDTPLPAEALRPHMLVFDTVYNPEQTRLLREAAERGCRVVSGTEMFVRQAARQFSMFTGCPAPVEFMRETLRAAMAKKRAT